MSNVPSDLKYAKSHEWVRVDGDFATVGITDHAQHELTDVVFVELPEVGKEVKAGDACAVVESVKTASDIYSPVAGEITEVNKAVSENPALVNTEPYAGGWLYRIKLGNPGELSSMPAEQVAQIAQANLPRRNTIQRNRRSVFEKWLAFGTGIVKAKRLGPSPPHVLVPKAVRWLDDRDDYEVDVIADEASSMK
jgi:glycine cleavage system H protein